MTDIGSTGRSLRVAHVDDHETVQLGLASMLAGEADIDLVVSMASVEPLLDQLDDIDLVVLDIRLSDGSTIEHNIAQLHDRGARVLVFTAADDYVAVREASKAGVLGIVRKSESRAVILDALRTAGAGESVPTTEWAAALDADPELPSAGLSPKELEVLALYAAGDKSITVAARAGLSANTVSEYVRRIRHKYAAVGRPAHTKIDLYKRAVEDGILPSPE